MTPEEFIINIRQVVFDSAVNGTLSVIQKAPGRKPSENLVVLSQWFMQLSDAEKEIFRSAIALAAHQATFGMLAVLDGSRQIDDGPAQGTLELRYLKNGRNVLLNGPDSAPLHDLFNQQEAPI
jgi:hypothetical protein